MENIKLKKAFANIFIFLVLALMYLPILLIIIYSFSGHSSFNFNNGVSLDSYVAMFQSPELATALKNTLYIALVSSLISTVMGTFAAIGIHNLGKRSSKIISNINQLPMINSEVVFAFSLMIFFLTIKLPDGYLKLILAHVSFCTPYVVVNVLPRLKQLDPNIYEAALDLGATPARALLQIQIPLLVPGIVSGFAMAFTLSIDDFIITQFNKGTIETLSTYLYQDARAKGFKDFWFPVFSIAFILILTILLVINVKMMNRNSSQKSK